MDIYPSGINVPNEPKEGYGKPVTNRGYTVGTFGVTVDKKPIPKEMVSFVPNVGGEVRNARLQELLAIEGLLKEQGYGIGKNEEGVTTLDLPSGLYSQEEMETEKLAVAIAKTESRLLKKFVALTGAYPDLDKRGNALAGKLKNPETLSVLQQLLKETDAVVREISNTALETSLPVESAKIDELEQKMADLKKIIERAKAEVAKIPTPTVAPEPQIKNEEPVTAPQEEEASTVPEASPKTPEKVEIVPKFFKVGQRFLLPKDHTSDEATWEVTILIPKEGAMMMKQIDGVQKGRAERFYFKPFKDLLEELYHTRRQAAATKMPEKPLTEAPKTSPKAGTKSSVLRPVTSPARTEKPPTSSPEEVLQKNRAQKEVREKFEDMFTHDQKAFISLYTTASVDRATYTENETFRKHPYRDVIRQVFFANNIPVTYLTQEEVAKRNDIRREQEHLTTTSLGSVYNPARDSAQAAGRTGIFSKPKEITSVGGMIQNSKTVLKEATVENPLRQVILGVEKNNEKNPQEKLKKIASVLSARIKNLSNNPNNLLKGKLSWVVFAVVVGGAGVAASYVKSALDKQPVSVSESLNENEVEIKDTWRKYYHFGKTHPDFVEIPEDISKLSANQLKETLIQKYAKSYFDGTNNPRQNLLALGMFGDLVRDDTTKGTYDHLDDKARAELSYLWDALNDVSMATSGEKLQAKTYEAAIIEVKDKVTAKEK